MIAQAEYRRRKSWWAFPAWYQYGSFSLRLIGWYFVFAGLRTAYRRSARGTLPRDARQGPQHYLRDRQKVVRPAGRELQRYVD